jgi:hypothetical protein
MIRGASKIIARRFKLVLDQFTHISGGLINKNKSQIYAWNVNAHVLIGTTHIFQLPFSIDCKYFKYLEMLICLKSLPSESWKVIL